MCRKREAGMFVFHSSVFGVKNEQMGGGEPAENDGERLLCHTAWRGEAC